jgi:hypothetical protein
MIAYDVGFDVHGKVSVLKVRGFFLCGAHMDLGFNDMMVLQMGIDQVGQALACGLKVQIFGRVYKKDGVKCGFSL